MASVLVLLGLYVYLYIKKDYEKASRILGVMFFHTLISLAIMSWSLILINEGFHIIGISLNWTPLAIFIIIIAFVIHFLDHYVRGKKGFLHVKTKEVRIYRILLPTAYVLAVSATAAVFYFNCFYFVFISSFN
jgi:hypothetical protein